MCSAVTTENLCFLRVLVYTREKGRIANMCEAEVYAEIKLWNYKTVIMLKKSSFALGNI